MATGSTITSLDGWLHLPEVVFPALKNAQEKGSVFAVHKVGFLAVSKQECVVAGINAEEQPPGKCLLPTAVVKLAGTPELCKLPISLGPWAFDCVAMAHSGVLEFPTQIEFGILEGRSYAEFVV
ncbi:MULTISPECIES: hypothetical protein [unclassified Rhodanobacter]|uniref:Uncharacterized protein n=1 Tax=Rhodanobacter humi TaxID=1888173 RepID=A0ABV4AQI8_9GAMM